MPQLTIKLAANISAADVMNWPNPAAAAVSFVIPRGCAFEPGAQGLSLSFLAKAIRSGASISVSCEFAFPTTEREFFDTVLSSTFGFALMRCCESFSFNDRPGNSNTTLRRFAGKIYDDRKGVVGLGSHVDVIALDPKRPIPRTFLARSDALDPQGIPLPSAFQGEIVRILASMGLPEIGSQSTLPTLISFIYELFNNTIQHGRPSEEAVAKQSTRSISFTKIAFGTQQLSTRRISPDLRDYLQRTAEMQKRDTNLFVVCISVMDMGDGIQNTLPAVSNDEESNTRLLRAFTMGQSRKPSGQVQRGLGLQKVVEAAFRLGARLQVTSAGRALVKDFSFGEDKQPDIRGAQEMALPGHFAQGTCVDIYIPNLWSNIDQRELIL
jgi:hypothetical protein